LIGGDPTSRQPHGLSRRRCRNFKPPVFHHFRAAAHTARYKAKTTDKRSRYSVLFGQEFVRMRLAQIGLPSVGEASNYADRLIVSKTARFLLPTCRLLPSQRRL